MTHKVIVVAGYGTGISHAVAAKWAKETHEGIKIALLSRTASKVESAAAALTTGHVVAKGYAVDLSDAAAVRQTIEHIRADLGPISILFWNPYGVTKAPLDATTEDWVSGFALTVTGLSSALQAAHDDLVANHGLVLVTGGGLSLESDATTQFAIQSASGTLAVAKAAQRKLVHILNLSLAPKHVYVLEVTVSGIIKGTAWDNGTLPTLEADEVAATFWELSAKRDPAVWNTVLNRM